MNIDSNEFNDLVLQEKKLVENISAMHVPNKQLVLDALAFAKQKHKGQFRHNKGRSDYIIHPVRVTRLLMEELKCSDEYILTSALLHDTIEDCNVSRDEIEKLFGNSVETMVASLSHNLFETKDLYNEHFKDEPESVKMIKIGDRIDNLRSIVEGNITELWTEARIKRFLVETEKYIVPLAKSLGPNYEELVGTPVSEINRMLEYK